MKIRHFSLTLLIAITIFSASSFANNENSENSSQAMDSVREEKDDLGTTLTKYYFAFKAEEITGSKKVDDLIVNNIRLIVFKLARGAFLADKNGELLDIVSREGTEYLVAKNYTALHISSIWAFPEAGEDNSVIERVLKEDNKVVGRITKLTAAEAKLYNAYRNLMTKQIKDLKANEDKAWYKVFENAKDISDANKWDDKLLELVDLRTVFFKNPAEVLNPNKDDPKK